MSPGPATGGSAAGSPDRQVATIDRLAERCRSAVWGALPERAIVTAKHCFLDWFGVALAGSREPLTDILVAATAGSGATNSLIGRTERAGELEAALINGTASHALDFDDMHLLMSGHPSVAIIPALLGASERDGATGEALVGAFVAGVEAACLLGAAMSGSHGAGWHTTGTIGVIGAAAACSQLLGAEVDAWRHAVALAATQAAGLRVMFGTMAKPLHAGKAASDGLLAARLAAHGFTANPYAIDAARGFVELYGGAPVAAPAAQSGEWAVEQMLFKYHAACFGTHASIENALGLRRSHGLGAADVALVELHVSPELDSICNLPSPSTGLEAKFSLRATTALGLLGHDTADPRTFSDAVVCDPAVTELRDRVRVVFDPDAAGRPTWAAMRLTTRSGEELATETDVGLPETDVAAREDRLRAKFRTLAGTVLAPSDLAVLESDLLRLERLDDVRPLLARCTAG